MLHQYTNPESNSPAVRISAIDSIRGIALLGILLMNIPYFSNAYQYAFNIELLKEYSGPNFWSWAIVYGLFEGTMRGIFSILFGAGALLILRKLEKSNERLLPADIYYRRLFWLLLFGLFNGFILLWPGDILYTYAIAGLVLFPFRNLSVKGLVISALVVLAIVTARENQDLYAKRAVMQKGEIAISLENKKVTLTEKQLEDLIAWKEFKSRENTDTLQKEAKKFIIKIHGSYPEVFDLIKNENIRVQTTEFYMTGIWDALLFMFLGMALLKAGILTGNKPYYVYALFTVIGWSVALLLNYMNLKSYLDLNFDPIKFLRGSFISYYEIRRVFHSLGILGLLLLLYKSDVISWFFKLMAPVGRMAFTNYLMQSAICAFIFLEYGLGMYGQLERYQTYLYIVMPIWTFQIIFSNLWLHFFKAGPFEWLWRSLTYWEFQPFKK
jgi:uncharacterized protein